MPYSPQIDDYVSWRNIEGWVYFICDDYMTIEIGVKPKSDDLVKQHKNWHCLVVCYVQEWKNVEYQYSRRINDTSLQPEMYKRCIKT